jgi:hypothetical protein
MIPIIYCAGPFRAETQWDIAENIRDMERIAYQVCLAGAFPLCPHTNTQHFHGSFTDGFFLRGTMELLRRCDGVVFHQGWKSSKGSRWEHVEAEKRKMPIFYVLGDIDQQSHAMREWIQSNIDHNTCGVTSADLIETDITSLTRRVEMLEALTCNCAE